MVDMKKMRAQRSPEASDKKRYLEMIQDIRNAAGTYGADSLSEWEEGFIDSVEEQLASGRSLSEKQREKLEGIGDKY